MNWTLYWLLGLATYICMVINLLDNWDDVTKEFPYLTHTQIVVAMLVSNIVLGIFWPIPIGLYIISKSCKLLAKGLRKLSSILRQKEIKASNGEQEL